MSKRFVIWITLLLLVVTLGVFVGAVQAQASELPPLTELGPYGVRVTTMDFIDPTRQDSTVQTYVWYPADKTDATPFMRGSPVLRDAPPDRSGAPYPLILYSHWYLGHSLDLSEMMANLASQGYVVAAPQHRDTQPLRFELVDRPLDIMLVLNGLAAITDGDLAGMIDMDNVGLMGYSQGGDAVIQMLGLLRDPVNFATWCAHHPEVKTDECNALPEVGTWDFDAIAAYRAQLGLQNLPDGTWEPFVDARIHAVLAIAPCDFPLTTADMLAAVTTPTMILHGTKDEYCDYEGDAVRTYTHLGTDDRYLISMVDGNHGSFYTRQDVPEHFAVAFFGKYLKSDETYAPYLAPEHLPTFRFVELVWGPYEGE